MKKLKYALIYVISLVLAVALTVVGTIAFLQDEEDTVNVMTVGNVYIDLHEYERAVNEDGTYKTATINGKESYVLQPFTQAKPLYPSTELDANGELYNFGAGDWDSTMVRMSQVGSHGSMQVFNSKLAVDKFVTVENTGKSDAYVRVFVAFEAGSVPADKLFKSVINYSDFMTDDKVWIRNAIGITNIDGNNYYVFEYLYNGAAHLGGVHANGVLPAGETTYVSLAQVYMHGTATNEDMEALDGNNNGTFDILTFAQAVQTAGFDNAATAFKAAFGDVEKGYHPWSDNAPELPAVVDDANGLAEALKSGKDVILTDDIDNAPVITAAPYGNKYGVAQNGGVLDGNGNALNFNSYSGDHYGIMTSGGTIKNLTVGGVFRGIVIMNPTKDVYIDNVTVGLDDYTCYGVNTAEGDGNRNIFISNSTLGGWNSFGSTMKRVTFTNCSFKQGTYYTNVTGRLVKPYVNAVFENCDFSDKYYIDLSALVAGHTVTLKNCTVNGVKLTAENWTSLIAPEDSCGAGQISIEGRDGSYMTASNVFDYVVIQ